jgi:hypothetical protein
MFTGVYHNLIIYKLFIFFLFEEKMQLPMEIVNKILSFRPTHPVAKLLEACIFRWKNPKKEYITFQDFVSFERYKKHNPKDPHGFDHGKSYVTWEDINPSDENHLIYRSRNISRIEYAKRKRRISSNRNSILRHFKRIATI